MDLRKRALERLAKERALYERRPGGGIALCLAYPNVYPLGMANLGFQSIFHIFESDSLVAAERAFLPDPDERALISKAGGRLRSFERGRALSEFDVLAFSVAFETDYLNVLAILRMAGIPLRSAEREAGRWPLVIAGGSAIFLNPEPLADFIDLFFVGEGEEMAPEFLRCYHATRGMERGARLRELGRIEGAYLPAWFHPVYDEAGGLRSLKYSGPGRPLVSRRFVRDLNRFRTASLILTEESVFGHLYLVEASRGCQWGCRFCAAGFMYRPIRYRAAGMLAEEAARGLAERKVVGLVGAEMASVPGIAEIAETVAGRGGRLSPSSLKADCISPRLARALARGGNRSVTLAPEAGSERMRKVINKNLSEEQILRAAEMMVGEGVERLKLYFMVGLPGERAEDVLAIARLVAKIGERARLRRQRIGRLTVSLNPFVPKPWTPFQWDPMEEPRILKGKIAAVRVALSRLGGMVEFDAESPRQAYFQTLISRGDRRVGAILARLAEAECDGPGPIWRELRRIARGNGDGVGDCPNPDFFVTRRFAHDERLPWDFIDHHVHRWFLLSERKKADFEHQTKPCDVTRCTVCGAC